MPQSIHESFRLSPMNDLAVPHQSIPAVSCSPGQLTEEDALDSPLSSNRQDDSLTTVELLKPESTETRLPKTATNTKVRSLYAKYFTDWWLLEIICWIVAAICIGAIMNTLYVHDGNPLPPVPKWYIGINTAIATFSTIAKATVTIVVASCLSQLKWIWFANSPRRLLDLQQFDDASRGAFGSITLLGNLKGGYIGALGACVTVLALAMSPATQQLVVTGPSAVEVPGTAVMPRCQNFTGASLVPKGMNERANLIRHLIRSNTKGDLAGQDDYAVTYQVTKALYDGLLFPLNTELPFVEPSCSTGNCTWEVYQSLAVCGSTADVTDQLSDIWAIVPAAANTPAPLLTIGDFPTEVNVTGFFLPNGAGILSSALNLTSNEPALFLASTPSNNGQQYPAHIDSLVFSNVAQPLGNFFVVFTVPAPAGGSDIPNGLPLTQVAFECILQLCVQSYNTTTVNGVSSTKVASSFINNTYGAGYSTDMALAGIHGQNLPYNSDKNPSNIYFASMDSILALQQYLSLFFVGAYGSAVGPSNKKIDGTGVLSNFTGPLWPSNGTRTADIPGGIYNAIGISSNIIYISFYLNNTKSMMNNIAISLTNIIRQGATVSEFAPGKTYQDQVLVRVRWLWIIFPLCLLTMTLILLISTMTSSHRAKTLVWKSSVNALLQCLSDDARKELGSVGCVSVVDKRSSLIDVSLEKDEEGWKLLKNV